MVSKAFFISESIRVDSVYYLYVNDSLQIGVPSLL